MATMTENPPAQQERGPRRAWGALVFFALAQLMVVLDGTIVNLALPRLQVDLGISDSLRPWVKDDEAPELDFQPYFWTEQFGLNLKASGFLPLAGTPEFSE